MATNRQLRFVLLCAAFASCPPASYAFIVPSVQPRHNIGELTKASPSALLSNTGSFFPTPWQPKPDQQKPKLVEKRKENGDVGPRLSKQELFNNLESRQLLGLKNPAHSLEKWKIRLQLTKPVTWIPLSLIVMCGAAASGNYHWMWNPWNAQDRDFWLGLHDAYLGFLTMILAGPFSEGFAQTINDWYDRDVDAINEPYRPIPSGAISPKEVLEQLTFLFFGGTSIAMGLDYMTGHGDFPVITAITLFGYFMSYIYSAPPLKLKQNGITGDLAIGLCYISLPWLCGHAVFGSFEKPVDWLLPIFYSLVGLGVGIVNDFKSMEGDKAFGLQSIPVLVGVQGAAWMASVIPDTIQLCVAAYLYSIGEHAAAAALVAIVLPQLYFQKTLLLDGDPLENDLTYMAMAQPFTFLGVLVTALCIGQHNFVVAQ